MADPQNTRETSSIPVTATVAAFVASADSRSLPADVIALGKKSILDGLGLALSGSIAHSGELVVQHLASQHLGAGPATVIGTGLKIAPRFAAFANGVAIHADDYDDTQLAVAPDRVYGLLTHPTAPALPAALATDQARYAGKTVVSYCTGGIRCEKAALHMQDIGMQHVYQLEGGILKYFEETGGTHWHGDCFVFDERGAVDLALAPAPPLPDGERATTA